MTPLHPRLTKTELLELNPSYVKSLSHLPHPYSIKAATYTITA